jgi:two-component system, NtrC family, response regulator PilR
VPRILLVEDDPDVLTLFEEVLHIAGYHVETAETFQAADNLLTSGGYDLLVTDGRLPDGTGVVLADKAKAQGIAALIVTGFLHALDLGSPSADLNQYTILRKPVTPQVLLGALTKTMAAANLHKTSG